MPIADVGATSHAGEAGDDVVAKGLTDHLHWEQAHLQVVTTSTWYEQRPNGATTQLRRQGGAVMGSVRQQESTPQGALWMLRV